ncbi:XdhC family protein [Shewanella marisflavi]|uniref:XdhC family protein n=1 Tax=Shewanella marisflavi TaxID=260364 RepID=UPI00200EF300|nr:XdhC family protein [Shewanella marisflavi]MCL1041427.1 XdhC family protein [Shewanella marisflavi]
MSHHIEDLVSAWASAPQDDWVLAVVTRVEGSAYRKVGAMMLIHGMGKSVGLVSGGCLEADLRRRAQQVLQTGQAVNVCYDASDETDASYQLGCGGIVHLMLVPLCADNHYLHFKRLKETLVNQGQCHYELQLTDPVTPLPRAMVWGDQQALDDARANWCLRDFPRAGILAGEQKSLIIPLRARYRIAIFGGGLDAQPVSMIAQQLGWQVDVIDRRTSYAREYDFPGAKVIKLPVDALDEAFWARIDGAIVMQHNLQLDAEALGQIAERATQLQYLALLGPGHRRDRVLALANLKQDAFKAFFSAPAGLALGGELPASIALSILSECHGVFHQGKRVALKEVMA